MSAAEHEAAIGRLLAELGDTADKVADTLRAKGIKGKRRKSCNCPIANYLDADPTIAYINVSQSGVSVTFNDTTYASIDTPQPVSEFIANFDNGVYLDLVEVDG